MKNFRLFHIALLAFSFGAFSSCTTLNKSMREPNTLLELSMEDFELSEQFTAEATSTKILNIDFQRLFSKNMGAVEGSMGSFSAASIPVVGSLVGDFTSSYALYELMNAHPGYDVVFYPQYEVKVQKPALGLGFLQKITTVKVTARLAKFAE